MVAGVADTPSVLNGMYAAEAEHLAAGGPGTAKFRIAAPFFASGVRPSYWDTAAIAAVCTASTHAT